MDRKPDIVCVSSIDWDFIWQGHQEIMSTFAAQGHRVLFLENTGVRAPQMRDLPRVRQRFRNWWRGTKGFRQERPNLFVFSPLVVPLPYSRVARWINRWLLGRALKRWMRATGLYRPIVWTFLPTPLAVDLIRELDPQLTIYYCIDDFVSSSPGARRIAASEQRLFRSADLVFVTSERLRARAAGFNERVHLFPFGVNFDRFDAIRLESPPLPEDLQALAHPVIGYVGGLHQWIDQELVAAVAQRLPGATFAMIGPAQTDVSVLEREPNIRLLGQRPHAELARYINGFDVGIVPYKLSEYTANVYPTKLNEYLVMGIPVVATDLPEIRRFNRDHGEIVTVATGADAFAEVAANAARGSSAAEIARRIEVAHTNSWPSRIASMQALIDEGIARRAATDQRWDAALRRAYRRTRWRAGQAALAALALYLLVFQTNLVWWCAEPLKLTAPPATADAIVVFAGGVGESGRAGGGAQERLKQAVDLYRAGYAPYVVLSSGFVYSFHEAEVMRTLAIDQGIPSSAIAMDERATNTYENVRYVDEILRDHHWRRILLVSSPYHMRRAVMVWRKQAPDVEVTPTPVPKSQFYDHARGATLDQARGILQEYLAIFRVLEAGVALTRAGWSRLLTVSVPAIAVAMFVAALLVEVWVRASWDARKGEPGFFLSDAVRGQRLAAGYDGWFAGVPVHINSLELRDPREYRLAKKSNTFRILFLGDSVTFGHGSVYEHTYPYLTEQRLKSWRPDIDWQVWNAAVPGYNTSQELAHLLEVGDRFAPDLVVVGFFDNDLTDDRPITPPGRLRITAARLLSVARRHLYSAELYKKVYLTLMWRLSGSDDYRRRMAHLGTEEALLASSDGSAMPEQRLTPYDRLTDDQVRQVDCVYGMTPNPDTVPAIERDPGFPAWLDAVRGFQRLAREGRYHIVFFANDAPPICHDTEATDLFYDGGSKAVDAMYLKILADGTPAVSSFDAFLHMRPSQMPNAAGHSIGNSNVVKAAVLFEFLRDSVLPTLIPNVRTSAVDP